MIYFATDAGYVYKVYIHGHRFYFETALSRTPVAAPVILDSGVFLICQEGMIAALNRDGVPLWNITSPELPSTPLVFGQNRLYFGADKGGVFSVELDGTIHKLCSLPDGVSSVQPDISSENLFAGCMDGKIYKISKDGRFQPIIQVDGKIMSHMTLDGRMLLFSSDTGLLYCLNLAHENIKWKIEVGSRIEVPIYVTKKYLFVLTWNGILYKIHKRSGSVGWWRVLPSHSVYNLVVIEDRVIVSSMSPALVCFDINTGTQLGFYSGENEIRSNPAWVAPYLLGHIYDRKESRGEILLLKKFIDVVLTTSKTSPQMPNEEIVVTATALGFVKPQYAFFFILGEKEESALNPSDESTWTWYPSEAGIYTLKVIVSDARLKREKRIVFTIKEKLLNAKEVIIYMDVLKVLVKMKWLFR
ncbi:MAG: PQQ-binding-like beta-propeller repeat protein [Candidatus Aminicenantes bacterium]|nr:PQQ-binding-like beta-propeller repeat protein [Candidatus Aminicenantes bacterium]